MIHIKQWMYVPAMRASRCVRASNSQSRATFAGSPLSNCNSLKTYTVLCKFIHNSHNLIGQFLKKLAYIYMTDAYYLTADAKSSRSTTADRARANTSSASIERKSIVVWTDDAVRYKCIDDSSHDSR